MDINMGNIGDVCCLYETGERICIKDVDDSFVTYESESGDTFVSKNFSFQAFVEKDPERIVRFQSNNRVGKALNLSEEKALRTLAFGNIADASERSVAQRVIELVKEQRSVLESRVKKEVYSYAPGAHLVNSFLSQLHSKGPGAEESFFGRRISNIGSPVMGVKIDGFACSYKDAGLLLSRSSKPQPSKDRKASLDSMISGASSRGSAPSHGISSPKKDIER